ncbi:MAG: hypothetical protein HY683_04575 [Chloroflexi bacterium]|nr:hypothetical protein [Chloroflexota bacterium]
MARALRYTVRLGRVGLPVWAVALAVVVMAAAAGQAIGPVLKGAVKGSASVTAEQSIVLAGASTNTHGSDDGVAVVNDEGTSFTAAIEQHVGDTGVKLRLDVQNVSNEDANAFLKLFTAAGIDAQIDSVDTTKVKEAQALDDTWLLWVKAGSHAELEITIELKDNAAPGFPGFFWGSYSIVGAIVQFGG